MADINTEEVAQRSRSFAAGGRRVEQRQRQQRKAGVPGTNSVGRGDSGHRRWQTETPVS